MVDFPPMFSRRAYGPLLVILALAIAVRLFLFTGYRNGDMGNYLQEAHNWTLGQYSVEQVLEGKTLDELVPGPKFNWQNLRVGFLLITAGSLELFGVRDAAYAVPMILFLLIGALTTYRLACEMISTEAGLVAATVFCFVPLEINLTTALVPHLPAAAMMGLAAYWLYRALGRPGRDGLLRAAAAGVAAAAAYSIWEFSILLTGVLGLFMFLRILAADAGQRSRPFVLGLVFLAGYLPLFAAEAAYFYRISGDPFFRQAFISQLSPLWIELHPADLKFLALDRYPRAIAASYYFGMTYYLILPGLVLTLIALIRRRGRAMVNAPLFLPLLWFVLLAGYLQFGTSSLSSYQPVFKLNHYLAVLTIPGALLAAEGLRQVGSRLPARLRTPLLLLVLGGFAGSSSLCAWVNHVGNGPYRQDVTHEIELRTALDGISTDGPIYTDDWTKDGLDWVYRYRRPVIAFNAIANMQAPELDLETLQPGLLLINRRYLAGEHTMSGDFPDWIEDPATYWPRVHQIGAPGSGVEIYAIGAGPRP